MIGGASATINGMFLEGFANARIHAAAIRLSETPRIFHLAGNILVAAEVQMLGVISGKADGYESCFAKSLTTKVTGAGARQGGGHKQGP